ncbi:ADAM 17-like protease [Mytilus edulis]|uniref:ADAM 17-like protease n=1 Tax=Mytilus edulis TaxID=6550 RepID=UPI0039EE68AD
MFICKLVHICLFVHVVYANHGSIDEKLGYYETLESVDIESVAKRSIGDSPHNKHVKFSALGRNFSLNLEVAKGLFTQDFKVHLVNSDGTFSDEHLDTNSFYYGTLDGEEKSEVNAFLHDGVISATISIPGESFIIEPAWRHIDTLVRASRTMMVYKGSDAKWPKEMEEAQKGGNGPNFCGAAHIDGDDGETAGVTHAHDHDEDEHDMPHSRRKRATGKKLCRLIAVADYKFYQTIAGNDIYDAANYIVGIIQKINLIYKPTNFGQGVGYGVELAMLKLHVAPTPTSTNKHYNMAQTWTNPYDLLTEFSQGDTWNDYCLAHLFTHQSFSNNVLGLAYIASSKLSNLGGICSAASTKNGRPIYYNTGLTTTKYTGGGTVLAKQSQLVTAHGKLRHNWGSEHDPTSGDCAPGSIIGNGKYLMYPFSVTGEDSNNDDFSTCSKTYINAVLKSKAESCFSEDTSEAPCGNGRVDSGEQCDGGYLGKFDLDPCCTTSCQLKTGSICSPSNHACCTMSCQRASAGVVCSSDVQETCTAESVCTGSSLICPQGANKPLGASCLDGGQCDGLGTCKAYCEARGLQSCVCGAVGDSCKRCCKSASAACTAVNQTAFHQDGRPCTVGYCRQGTCINSDPSYISRFFDLIDQISFDFIAEAFKTNMVAFIQVFSLLIWVPLSCVVWCRDKRSQKWSRNELNIKKRENRNLMVDQDGRPIKRPAKKPRSDNPYLSMEPRSLSGRPYSSRSPSTKPGKSQKNKVKPNRRRKDENHLNMSRDLDGDSVA